MKVDPIRSKIMRAVPQRETSPEMAVRKFVFAKGLRYRVHVRALPGSPDLVFPKYKTCIFVHGCYWHRHPGCKKASTPKSNRDYWLPKFQANVERDARKAKALLDLGWKVETIWECEAMDSSTLEDRINEIFPHLIDSKNR